MHRLDSLEAQLSTSKYVIPSSNPTGLEARIIVLKQESARARAAEGDAVAFYDLGFRSTIKSNA